jgi:hypothetical protein
MQSGPEKSNIFTVTKESQFQINVGPQFSIKWATRMETYMVGIVAMVVSFEVD